MRLIQRFKLRRVIYGDLDVGDEYSRVDFCPEIIKVKGVNREQLHLEVKARNTTKYPPESATYDIVGIPDEYWWNAVGELGELPLDWFDESEIETVYE